MRASNAAPLTTLQQDSLTVIDLFAGAGGLSEGFRQAGFAILAGSDFNKDAAETFRHSHPEAVFFERPIQELGTDELLSTLGLEVGSLDVLLGGPPCQAFSVYNHQRGMHDERSGLFREYLRIVEGLMPRFVVMENVTGITSVAAGRAVQEIERSLQRLGYHVEHRILRADEYGVPQERRRIFFLAARDHQNIPWPTPTHGPRTSLFEADKLPFTTVEEAIGDLPPLAIKEGEEVAGYDREPASEYQRYSRAQADLLYNHVAPALGAINLERLKHIPQGGELARHPAPSFACWDEEGEKERPHQTLRQAGPAGSRQHHPDQVRPPLGSLHPSRPGENLDRAGGRAIPVVS